MFKRFLAVLELLRQLGDKRSALLVDPSNTKKVKEFCDILAQDALPTTLTIDGRTYDIISFHKGDEESVDSRTMIKRAKKMKANLDYDDGRHWLEHQDEIPEVFRDKVKFIFTNWHGQYGREYISYILWDTEHLTDRWSDRYVKRWIRLSTPPEGHNWNRKFRLLRRRS